MRKARDLVRSNPRDLAASHPQFAQEVERELKETERQASLNARLPAILGGKLKPTDASETVGLAQLCYDKRLYGASARFWAEAFQAGPKLAEDMKAQNSYNAACAAAQAGGGQGKDEPPLEDTARAGWRKRAIDWLKADLAFWTKQVETGPPQARAPRRPNPPALESRLRPGRNSRRGIPGQAAREREEGMSGAVD